ncbi:LCP family protein [Candidatus Kurthia intestinigallinarum]|uniref:LCP family protein n=1 Tax=Candidatus Kurthia intestinigallinarum TaxID=1562256 RepID=UPI0018F2EE9D|nr:LCP family protein [Kurthia sp. 3B1D]
MPEKKKGTRQQARSSSSTSTSKAKSHAKSRTSKSQERKKKEKESGGCLWKILLVVLILLLTFGGGYIYYLFHSGKKAAENAYVENSRTKSELRDESVQPLTDNISIMIVGIDDSEKRSQGEGNSRSDALLVATLNNKDKSIKLVSIPRDSYVYIPTVGYKDKITHAHAYGGIDATRETVEGLLNVPIDYYFRVNFDAFIEIVDALGGVTVDVPYEINELDENDKRTVHLMPGTQEVNGREALALARTRHQDSDVERGKRQQMILEAIASKATSVTSFTKYDKVLAAVGNNMQTDMTFDEMKSLFAYLQNGMPNIDSLSLKGSDDMSSGIYYYLLQDDSLLETRQTLQKHLGLTIDTKLNLSEDEEVIEEPTTEQNTGFQSNYNSSGSGN